MHRFITLSALTASLLAGCVTMDNVQHQRDMRLTHDASALSSELVAHRQGAVPIEIETASSVGRAMLEPRVKNGSAEIKLLEAIQLGLANSRIVRVTDGDSVQSSSSTFYDIETAEAREGAALAAFDATLEASIYGRDLKRPPNAFFGPGLAQPLSRDEAALNFGLRKPMVTGGQASLAYNPDPGYFFVANPSGGGFNPIRNTNIQLSVTQPLLRGAGRRINLIPLQITQIGIDQSTWDFKKTMMESVRGIITAYWDLYSARAAISAIDEVIPLFEEIVRLQEEALAAGWVVKADVAKAYAQLHDFRKSRLRLESEGVAQELRLRNLIGMPPDLKWKLVPATKPTSVTMSQSAEELLQQAMQSQPDIVQQRLNVRIRQLELTVAENQLKPNLDINGLYRMNGIGENLGDALDQLATADFRDWQFGANLSVPLGRRAAHAGVFAADRKLLKDSELLQQQVFSVYHDLVSSRQRLDYAYRQFEEAEKRLAVAEEWVQGARLRYQNPNPNDGGQNWLLENLNDYLDAIRFKTRAASEMAELLAEYNIELSRIEQIKGTLLDFFGVHFAGDPCRQGGRLPVEGQSLEVLQNSPASKDNVSSALAISNAVDAQVDNLRNLPISNRPEPIAVPDSRIEQPVLRQPYQSQQHTFESRPQHPSRYPLTHSLPGSASRSQFSMPVNRIETPEQKTIAPSASTTLQNSGTYFSVIEEIEREMQSPVYSR